MTFGSPHLLWLLLLVPAAAALLWWSWRARQRAMAQFIGSRLLASLTVGLSTTRRKIRLAMLLLALTLIVFAMARPQWGYTVEEARQRGLDIVVAIDTSKSMLADDIQPNRLARAKLAALDLLRISQTDRLGLVAFAGSAFLQCPLSLDDEAFRQSVEALDVSIIPQGGTAIAEAIEAALSAFKEKTENHKILVLFTDGEEHEGTETVLEAVRAAEKEGMRIFTIGVGTPAGELLSSTDPYGNRVFIKDASGNVVKSRLNEALLQDIARETDGFYLPLGGGRAMEVLYERGLAPLPKAEFSARTVRRYHERYQWFLGLGILLLLVEMFFPERTKRAGANTPVTPVASVLAAMLLLGMGQAHGAARDALNKYERGKYTESRLEFERLAKKSPNDARLRYNAGAAAFQDGSYQEALNHFSAALASPDLKLQEQSYYNLGNSRFRAGEKESDPKQKQQLWEQAIRDYENALKLNPQDADAKFNSEVVKHKLEELKQQQQQQQQQNQDKQQDQQQKNDEQNKDQQKQDEQGKQDQQKQEKDQGEQKKEEQQSQQEQQQQQQDQQKQDASKADQEKKDQQAQQAPQDQRGEQPDQAAQAAQYGKVMQMTPQQAMQLLEAQKSDEKAMIFVPQNVKTNKPGNRVFKDW